MNAIFVAAVANEVAVLHARAQQLVGAEVRSELQIHALQLGNHAEWRCYWGVIDGSELAWSCRRVINIYGQERASWGITRAGTTVISSDGIRRGDTSPRSADGLEELAQLLAREEGGADAV